MFDRKKYVLFLLFCCFCCFYVLDSVSAVIYINGCQALGASDTYILTQDVTDDTFNCFNVDTSNMVIDLNGHTIDGDSTDIDYGFFIPLWRTNITIKNGVIKQYNRGISHSSSTVSSATLGIKVENVTFVENVAYDVYVHNSNSGTQSLELNDNTFSKPLHIFGINDVKVGDFSGKVFWEVTGSGAVDFVGSSDVYLNYFNFDNYNFTTNGKKIHVDNICACTLGGGDVIFTDGVEIVVEADDYDAGGCFEINTDDVDLNLNGHTVEGDGSSMVNGIRFVNGVDNAFVHDGTIQGYYYSIIYSSSSVGTVDVVIDNVSVVGSVVYDIFFSNSAAGDQRILVKNSQFADATYFNNMEDVQLYGNTFVNAGEITDTSNTVFSLNPLVDGSNNVGNIWGNFVCSDSSLNHTVEYENYVYTICDSNSYSDNGFSDSDPIISVKYVPPVGGGSGSSGSGSNDAEFDFGSFKSLFIAFSGVIFGIVLVL